MLVMACITFVRGGKDTECFGRKITMENFRTGFAVAMLAFMVFITGTVTVLIIEPASVPLINVMYETASAIGTVGLRADLIGPAWGSRWRSSWHQRMKNWPADAGPGIRGEAELQRQDQRIAERTDYGWIMEED